MLVYETYPDSFTTTEHVNPSNKTLVITKTDHKCLCPQTYHDCLRCLFSKTMSTENGPLLNIYSETDMNS